MNDLSADKLAIRELVENWVLHRDAGDWERFAAVWHPNGWMTATWFKKTSEIIPMCHPLNLSHVGVNFFPSEKESRIDIEAKVRIKARTGVEMEALVAVATGGLTI